MIGDITRTYDDKQMEVLLVQCMRCRRFWYMTLPRFVCAVCRRVTRPLGM